MTPAIGDQVAYRSIAGETWDAIVVDVRSLEGRATLVDVDVFFPGGLKSTHTLKGVRWHADPADPMPGARRKVTT